MGKITGFLEYGRVDNLTLSPLERIKNFKEFHKPIVREERKKQAARCMDCGVPFCQYGKVINGFSSGCPLNNLIPEWNDLLYKDQYPQALKRLLKTNNFPEFTSRVCPNPCEKACTNSLYGDAVTIHENEYAIIENGYKSGIITPRIPEFRTEKHIAVVGSGPAGLAVADMLNQRGHHVTVYERDDRPGGLLMYGIPNMKLDKSVITRKVDLLAKEGIEFIYNQNIHTAKQAQNLINDYDAVVLTCGSKKARDIQVPGREGNGIYFAVDYLTQVTKSLLNSKLADKKYPVTKDKKVLVIGGGDTGNDCIGTAIRLGCSSVVQLEMMEEPPLTRRENNPWPEWPLVKKTDYGQEEAIALFGHDPRIYQTTVDSFILDENKNIIGANIVSLERKDGRMVPVEGSIKKIDCDLVLIAAGFVGCENEITKAFKLDLTKRGTVADQNYQTNVEKVFTAGDMRRGQSLVVNAIAEGRSAAYEVDCYLMGYSNLK